MLNINSKRFIDKFDKLKIKYKKDPKKFVMLVVSIVFLFTLTIGSSYAYLTYISKTGNTTKIEAGTLALNFKNETNSILLNGAFPMKDEEGLALDNEYEFTIENTGTLPASYEITLDNTCVAGKSYTINGESINADICIPQNYIKVGLKEGTSEYKVLENPYNWKTKGAPKINGATLTDDGMTFDGENDYIDMGNANYDFNNQLTIGARFKVDSLKSSGSAIIDSYNYNNGSGDGFEFFVSSTGRIVFQYWDDNHTKKYVSSTETIELNKWYTTMFSYDGTSMKLYLNGELVASDNVSVDLRPSSKSMMIGAIPGYVGSETNYGFFDGVISDVLVINEALSDVEITNNYNDEFNYQENTKTLFYQRWYKDSKYIIDAGNLNGGKSKSYKMKLWLDYDTPNAYNSQGVLNVIYSGKLGLSYEQGVTVAEPAAEVLISKVGSGGLEEITHSADSTLQIGSTEALTEYRYRGANPDNYVSFNNEVWRIIGVFPTDDGTGKIENRLKLIDYNNSDSSKWNYEWSNTWDTSTMRSNVLYVYETLIDNYKSMVGPAKFYLGGPANLEITAEQSYFIERKISGSDYYYQNNSTFSVDYAGLLYLSDYAYAASSDCTSTLFQYNNGSCVDSNWLFGGIWEWFITHNSSESEGVYRVNEQGVLNSFSAYNGNYIYRPVVYLNANVTISSGSGTISDPYILE